MDFQVWLAQKRARLAYLERLALQADRDNDMSAYWGYVSEALELKDYIRWEVAKREGVETI